MKLVVFPLTELKKVFQIGLGENLKLVILIACLSEADQEEVIELYGCPVGRLRVQ